jgi:DNA-binding NtrC family response regulator
MADKFDFITASDKPALVASSNPELLEAAKVALHELGYKVHTAATHGDFMIRFSQIRYQVVVLEELFCANTPAENSTLLALQTMPMSQRRHATIILIGDSFQTFTPMQALRQSVHAVVNPTELFLLRQLIEKAVADNNMFLHSFREVQSRLISGKARD